MKIISARSLCVSLVAVLVAFGGSTGFGEESSDGDSLMPLTENSPTSEGFSVGMRKDKKAKVDVEVKLVQLIKPGSNSQFTPGVLNFNWKVRTDVKKDKMTCVVENTESGKVISKDVRGDQATFEMKPGNYRWRVVSSDSKIKSSWRVFEVTQAEFDGRGRAADLDMDNLASQHAAVDVGHNDVSDDGKVDDDKKLREYKQKRKLAEAEANDLEKRVKSAELDARKALQIAKDQQNRLKAARLEKLREDKLAKERFAKLEADRKAKIKREKLARAKQLKDIHIAQLKVKDLNKRLQIKILEAKKAKLDADRATAELTAKIDAIKKSTMTASATSESARAPASQPEAKASEDSDPDPLPTDDN